MTFYLFKNKKEIDKPVDIPIDVKIEFIKKHLKKKFRKIEVNSTKISMDISNGYTESLIKDMERRLDNNICCMREDDKELKKKIKKYLIKHYLKETTLTEYTQWLYGYLKRGGKIFQYFDWNFKDRIHQFYTVKKSFIFPTAFWGNFLRFKVLVPEGFKVGIRDDIGHCCIYQSDFTIYPDRQAEPCCYNDVLVEINKLEKLNR